MKRLLIGAASLLLAGSVLAHGNTTAEEKSDSMKTALVAGEVSKRDVATKSLTIALPSGDFQVLKVSSDAKIMRDGNLIGFADLKEGESVRASFDPQTNVVLSVDVIAKTVAPPVRELGGMPQTGGPSKAPAPILKK